MHDLFRAVAETTGFAEKEACGSKWESLSGKLFAPLFFSYNNARKAFSFREFTFSSSDVGLVANESQLFLSTFGGRLSYAWHYQ